MDMPSCAVSLEDGSRWEAKNEWDPPQSRVWDAPLGPVTGQKWDAADNRDFRRENWRKSNAQIDICDAGGGARRRILPIVDRLLAWRRTAPALVGSRQCHGLSFGGNRRWKIPSAAVASYASRLPPPTRPRVPNVPLHGGLKGIPFHLIIQLEMPGSCPAFLVAFGFSSKRMRPRQSEWNIRMARKTTPPVQTCRIPRFRSSPKARFGSPHAPAGARGIPLPLSLSIDTAGGPQSGHLIAVIFCLAAQHSAQRC